ncbi:hypothetical protein [Gracilimonas tropica]|uniref:hypothetical protein n=1 Tax=Gracilimonas tropica TaxID=454600 RepID=UPI00035D4FEA|nr:hypothetical protein [Gracilimonas tropica]
MKKAFLIIVALVLASFLYVNFITNVYAHFQAQSICEWLNEKKEGKPAVGPQAFEHLTWLRKSSVGEYECMVVEPYQDFYSDRVSSILISENDIDKIYLSYELRYFLQPTYFHHQTNFKHKHR